MSMMRAVATFINVVYLLGLIQPTIATDTPGGSLPFISLSLHDNLRRDALAQVSSPSRWVRRAPAPQQSEMPAPMPILNEQEFNETATAACLDALDDVTYVVNPSGMAACYNIPFINLTTGTFAADIRLYQVLPPSGQFEGIPSSNYTLEMIIPAAIVSTPDRLQSNMSTGPNSPILLQDFRHIGQLDRGLSFDKLSMQDFRILLIPNITITARDLSNNTVISTLSSDTLSYVAGFFTNEDGSPNNITFPDAANRAPDIVAMATIFVIPGTAIEIFPIGLIVTSIWTGLFFITVGLGTLGRMQFREQFKGRMQTDAFRRKF